MFDWSLNPYMGCVHRCTFCYVRAFERRADRPSDDRYGTSIRVKVNVADVLRRELARPSLGARVRRDRRRHRSVPARRGPLPADPRLHRGASARRAHPFSIITRGPMIVRDVDVLVEAARRRQRLGHVLDPDARRGRLARTEPSTAHPAPAPACRRTTRRGRHQDRRRHGARSSRDLRPPGAARARSSKLHREAGATGVWTNLLFLRPGTREHFLEHLAEDWPELVPRYRELYRNRAYLPAEETTPGAPPGFRPGPRARRRRPPGPSR